MKKTGILQRLTLVIALSVLLFVPSVSAQQSTGLGIAPRKDYTIKPGGSASDTLRVTNLSKTETLRLTVDVVDFTAQGETGTPALQLRDDAPVMSWSIKPFVTLPKEVTLEPGKTVNVPIKIAIPEKQGGGSYYGAVQYVAKTGQGDKNMAVAASGATLVFVNVQGVVREHMTLKEFGAYLPSDDGQNGVFKKFFFGSRPRVLAYILHNDGNMVEQPKGAAVVTSMSGAKVATVGDANPKSSSALIGQSRRFEACIVTTEKEIKTPAGTVKQPVCDEPDFGPGRYKASITILYGNANQNSYQIVASNTFWYLPLWFVMALVALFTVVVFTIWVLARSIAGRVKARKKSK